MATDTHERRVDPNNPNYLCERFDALAKELRQAGCSSTDANLACLRTFLCMQIDRFADDDGSMSEEVYRKMRHIVSHMVSEEFDLMYDCPVVRRRASAPVLKLVPRKRERAIIKR
jgi:hypothetical protein